MLDLLAALDRFLEAASRATKRRAIARLEGTLETAAAKMFRAQGALLVEGIEKLPRHQYPVHWSQKEAVGRRGIGGYPDYGIPNFREADEPPAPDLPELELMLEELVKAGASTAEILNEAAQVLIAQALEAGAQSALDAADVSLVFDLTSPAAVAFLQENAATLVAGINQTTAAQLRSLIVKAVQDGKSYTDLATSITDLFEGFTDARAKTIAVTEIGNAYEEGALQASKALDAAGLIMQKSWLTVGDDKVDPDCLDNEAAGWIALGEEFPSGAARPLDHPNCRCTMLSRRKPKTEEKVQ